VHPINATHDWILAHPVAMMLILFCVSAALSLFAQEIKRFFTTWPVRALNSATRNNLTNRLRTLESLHQNPYLLLIYFGLTFAETVMAIVIWSILWMFAYLAIFHTLLPNGFIPSIACGIFVSKVQIFGAVLKDLCQYEKVTTKLRTSIEQIDQQIAKQQKEKETAASKISN
jgi:hypothetical protein